MFKPKHQPSGKPVGGQFAPNEHGEPTLSLEGNLQPWDAPGEEAGFPTPKDYIAAAQSRTDRVARQDRVAELTVRRREGGFRVPPGLLAASMNLKTLQRMHKTGAYSGSEEGLLEDIAAEEARIDAMKAALSSGIKEIRENSRAQKAARKSGERAE
jgi:hypothetical protein